MKLQVFLQNGERNDATSRYIDTVVQALAQQFDCIEYVDRVDNISAHNWKLVITLRAYWKLLKRRKTNNTIFWFQGVEPEELLMCGNNRTLRQRLRIKWFSWLERRVLFHASLILFVSNAMHRHYLAKYGYTRQNYVVAPCMNSALIRNRFCKEGKYASPSFVYAGGLSQWQCFGHTLDLFRHIRDSFPTARLALFTKETDAANKACKNKGLDNVEVCSVPLEEIESRLSEFKYGIMLREDTIVNNVATPTKFNTYTACGLIPIMTDAVKDFASAVASMKFKILLSAPDDYDTAIRKLKFLEAEPPKADEVEADFEQSLYSSYYNPEIYCTKIAEKFQQIRAER